MERNDTKHDTKHDTNLQHVLNHTKQKPDDKERTHLQKTHTSSPQRNIHTHTYGSFKRNGIIKWYTLNQKEMVEIFRMNYEEG